MEQRTYTISIKELNKFLFPMQGKIGIEELTFIHREEEIDGIKHSILSICGTTPNNIIDLKEIINLANIE